MNGYNVVTSGYAIIECHTVGGFLVGGDLHADNHFENRYDSTCYVGGYICDEEVSDEAWF